MNRLVRWIVIVTLIMSPHQLYGEYALSKVVTHSDMSILLGDKKLKNRRIELVSDKGVITHGKLIGFANGTVLLQAAPAVPFCNISLVRLSRNVTNPWRRIAGITGGVLAGLLLAAPLTIGLGSNGFEPAALMTFFALPIAGGWTGAKLVAQRQDVIYLLDPAQHSGCVLPLSEGL